MLTIGKSSLGQPLKVIRVSTGQLTKNGEAKPAVWIDGGESKRLRLVCCQASGLQSRFRISLVIRPSSFGSLYNSSSLTYLLYCCVRTPACGTRRVPPRSWVSRNLSDGALTAGLQRLWPWPTSGSPPHAPLSPPRTATGGLGHFLVARPPERSTEPQQCSVSN
jgi:hypothetical protein